MTMISQESQYLHRSSGKLKKKITNCFSLQQYFMSSKFNQSCGHFWATQQWSQDWKRSVFIPIPKKGNAKECSNYCTIALILHISKVMLKILQARLQQYVNHEIPDVQAGFRKGRGTRDQIANIHWITRKTSISALLTIPKALTVQVITNENSERDGNTRPLDLPREKPVCRSGSNSQNWTWNNRLVPNRKRSTTSRLYIVTLLI